MSLSVGGLITGLDTDSIISKLMQVEQRPIALLQQKEADFQVRLSSYGILKGAMSGLKSAAEALKEISAFQGNKISASHEDILTASVNSEAVKGKYSIKVMELAQEEKVMTDSFSSSDTSVGTGVLTIKVGAGEPIEIEITEDNNTLEDIAQSINDADGDVTAGIIKQDDNNYYLVLSSSKTGTDNTISVTVDDDDENDSDTNGLSKLASTNLTVNQPAKNAQIIIDGIENIERQANTIDDLIPGVTLDLLQKNDSESVTVTVERDYDSIKNKIESFVSAYNSVVDAFSSAQKYNAETGEAGALLGDSSAMSMRNRIRSLIGTTVSGLPDNANSLSRIGIATDTNGKLSIDSSKLDDALKNNRNDVQTLFTQETSGNEGIALKFFNHLDGVLDAIDGLFATKEESINKAIQGIHSDIERIGLRLEKREENLRRQFIALETVMGQIQATGDFLTQQLDGLAELSSSINKR
jgi:flagellar hook-associated protein 2